MVIYLDHSWNQIFQAPQIMMVQGLEWPDPMDPQFEMSIQDSQLEVWPSELSMTEVEI